VLQHPACRERLHAQGRLQGLRRREELRHRHKGRARLRLRLRHLRSARRPEPPRPPALTGAHAGFKPQTQQGADLLAAALGAEVYMPDFFAPAPPWPADQFPPTTDEQKAKLQEFFGGPAAPPKSAEALRRIAEQLKKDGAAKVGAFGFCWGTLVSPNPDMRECADACF
jgi:hypothetical protein